MICEECGEGKITNLNGLCMRCEIKLEMMGRLCKKCKKKTFTGPNGLCIQCDLENKIMPKFNMGFGNKFDFGGWDSDCDGEYPNGGFGFNFNDFPFGKQRKSSKDYKTKGDENTMGKKAKLASESGKYHAKAHCLNCNFEGEIISKFGVEIDENICPKCGTKNLHSVF